MNRLLDELGDAALQGTLLQEREYAAALDRLPDDVVVVFEEHPGMFRTPRQETDPGTEIRSPAPPPSRHRPASGASAGPMNDAATFQTALRERGTLVSSLFGGKTGR